MHLTTRLRRGLAVVAASACAFAGLTAVAPAATGATSDLIISEYIEGSSNNKAVEIWNGTEAPVDLTGYSLKVYSNGSSNAGLSLALTGTLAPGDVHVVAHSSAVAAITDQADLTTSVGLWNGDDAITLTKGEVVVDSLGRVGEDPGTEWGTGNLSTADNTLRRQAGGVADTDPSDAVTLTGWDGFANGTFDGLGWHLTRPGTDPDPDPQPTIVPIAQIQGTGTTTLLNNQTVTTRGVVTATYPTGGFNGLYLQTPGTGGTAKAAGEASDGIFVFSATAASTATVGDCVQVEGKATEYNGLTQLSGSVVVTTLAAAECAPVVPTALATLPVTDADKERYEGMLVHPQGTYTITNNYQLNQYGQLGLTPGEQPLYQATDVVEPGAEAAAYEAANQARYITLDDGSSWDYLRNATAQNSPLPYLSAATPMRTASQVTFSQPVILDYRFQWNYQPTGQVVGHDDPDIPVASENDREVTVPEVGGNITLGAFNVLNYFDDLGEDEVGCRYYADIYGDPVAANNCQVRGAYDPDSFADQQEKIVAAINQMDADVLALMEIENSSGVSYLPGQPRDKALATLVEALNEDDEEPRWAYAPSPVVTGPNEDVIRTAFIYNPSTVQLLGPSLIDLDEAFADARYPLAQKFKARNTGKPFVAIANHFKSKGSGADDQTGQGLANPSREAQARQLTAWASEMFSDEAIFLMGDFNAYSKETPIQIIEDAGYLNLAKAYEPDSHTYQFSGRLGSLDHAFANAEAMRLVTGAAVWDINGDESIAFQYSRRLYNVIDFHRTDEFASSDHDPVVVGLDTGNRGNGKQKG